MSSDHHLYTAHMLCMFEHVRCCVRGRFVCNDGTFALRNVFSVPSAKAHYTGPSHAHRPAEIGRGVRPLACNCMVPPGWTPSPASGGLCVRERDGSWSVVAKRDETGSAPVEQRSAGTTARISYRNTSRSGREQTSTHMGAVRVISLVLGDAARASHTGPTRAAHAVCPSREHHPRSVIRCYCVRCA